MKIIYDGAEKYSQTDKETGFWMWNEGEEYICSECNEVTEEQKGHCPFCGRKMIIHKLETIELEKTR